MDTETEVLLPSSFRKANGGDKDEDRVVVSLSTSITKKKSIMAIVGAIAVAVVVVLITIINKSNNYNNLYEISHLSESLSLLDNSPSPPKCLSVTGCNVLTMINPNMNFGFKFSTVAIDKICDDPEYKYGTRNDNVVVSPGTSHLEGKTAVNVIREGNPDAFSNWLATTVEVNIYGDAPDGCSFVSLGVVQKVPQSCAATSFNFTFHVDYSPHVDVFGHTRFLITDCPGHKHPVTSCSFYAWDYTDNHSHEGNPLKDTSVFMVSPAFDNHGRPSMGIEVLRFTSFGRYSPEAPFF